MQLQWNKIGLAVFCITLAATAAHAQQSDNSIAISPQPESAQQQAPMQLAQNADDDSKQSKKRHKNTHRRRLTDEVNSALENSSDEEGVDENYYPYDDAPPYWQPEQPPYWRERAWPQDQYQDNAPSWQDERASRAHNQEIEEEEFRAYQRSWVHPGESRQPAEHRHKAIPREEVAYDGREPAGTVIIDTEARRLFYVLGDGRAIRYGIGVGRPGFEWAGVKKVSRKEEWPEWTPPEEMVKRRPDLPRYMPGGVNNPLGARAIYLGSSLYRIHGSNEPETIGQAVSSGCIRMTNDDVEDLYQRVKIGTKVVVR